jgi:nicotinamidase/pyrazinamidase
VLAMKKAIIIVDVQRDFCEGGVLPARYTESLIAPLNVVITWRIQHEITCVFTHDWHPVNHCSFQSQGGPWPPHCIQDTLGAEFAIGLHFSNSALVIDVEKDFDRSNMSDSAFEDTDLKAELLTREVIEVAICGIATDYCVKATALDALRFGFRVSVLTDLVTIDVHAGDSANALVKMKAAGTMLLTSDGTKRQVFQ